MKLIISLFLILFLGFNLNAEQFIAHTGADFLKYGMGAKASAMGESSVGLHSDVFATYWNPAGLSGIKKLEFGAMHSEAVGDASVDFLGVVYPCSLGVIGISSIFFIPVSIPVTDYNGETLGEIEWLDYALNLSYARQIVKNFSLGATLKMITRRESDPIFGVTKGKAYAGEFGFIYQFPLQGLSFGFALLNYGDKLQMQGESRKDDLPQTIRLGLAYKVFRGNFGSLTLSCDNNKILNSKWYTNIGIEYAFGESLFLRSGYLQKEGNIEGITYGAGIRIKNYQIDYANVPASEMIGQRRANKISLVVSF